MVNIVCNFNGQDFPVWENFHMFSCGHHHCNSCIIVLSFIDTKIDIWVFTEYTFENLINIVKPKGYGLVIGIGEIKMKLT